MKIFIHYSTRMPEMTYALMEAAYVHPSMRVVIKPNHVVSSCCDYYDKPRRRATRLTSFRDAAKIIVHRG